MRIHFYILLYKLFHSMKASLKNILVSRHQREPLEEITNGLIMRLIKRMCSASQKDSQIDSGMNHMILTMRSHAGTAFPKCQLNHILSLLSYE